jgi:hypothetical protein
LIQFPADFPIAGNLDHVKWNLCLKPCIK